MPKKNVFLGYTAEQIAEAEAYGYIVHVGTDIFSYKGKYTFSHKSAMYFRNKIKDNLLEIIKEGEEKEVSNAHRCLLSLRIAPLRIH